ncbi:PREDICTED: glutamic acid-rich protein-like [Ipomoea nil]|uniref:glutamic acid-rich protein-like n=1 Tax=Ipomoea nil TaxID=35883 RepID=UPI0009014226|nr:PREDICTED: glutamic acid-rich protein-like [Ipomoea nil]
MRNEEECTLAWIGTQNVYEATRLETINWVYSYKLTNRSIAKGKAPISFDIKKPPLDPIFEAEMKELREAMRLSKIKTELEKLHQNDPNCSISGTKDVEPSDNIPEADTDKRGERKEGENQEQKEGNQEDEKEGHQVEKEDGDEEEEKEGSENESEKDDEDEEDDEEGNDDSNRDTNDDEESDESSDNDNDPGNEGVVVIRTSDVKNEKDSEP